MKIKIINACILIILLTSIASNGQSAERVPVDDNFTLTLAFHKTDTVLVVIPNTFTLSYTDKHDIENYVFWDKWQKKPAYKYKREKELSESDLSMNIQFYGPYYLFYDKSLLNIPFKQIKDGFSLAGVDYDSPNDAFFYINNDATRMYTCKNSILLNNVFIPFGSGAYQLYIFRGNELMINGFSDSQSGKLRLNNMTALRQNYFNQISTNYFDFEISKELKLESIKEIMTRDIDSYVNSLCGHLQIDSNIKRLKTYVYSNMSDLQFFIAVPKAMTVYGKSIGNISHLQNFDLTIFKHETAHSIIENKIGKISNAFFLEGFATYTSYFYSNEAYLNDLEIARSNIDLLNKKIMLDNSTDFYSNMTHYPISATFTKYIIDLIGLNEFKKAYSSGNIEYSILNITRKNLDQLIDDYKKSILK